MKEIEECSRCSNEADYWRPDPVLEVEGEAPEPEPWCIDCFEERLEDIN